MSSRSKEDPGHQAALPRDDCQEHEEVLHIRGPGPGRQECEEEVPSQQLPVHHQGEAVHLHNAHEAGRGMEPDPVQSGGFHQEWVYICFEKSLSFLNQNLCIVLKFLKFPLESNSKF